MRRHPESPSRLRRDLRLRLRLESLRAFGLDRFRRGVDDFEAEKVAERTNLVRRIGREGKGRGFEGSNLVTDFAIVLHGLGCDGGWGGKRGRRRDGDGADGILIEVVVALLNDDLWARLTKVMGRERFVEGLESKSR